MSRLAQLGKFEMGIKRDKYSKFSCKDDNVFFTGKYVPTSVRERLPESISNTFALIQSIEYSVGGNRTRQYWPLLNGPLNKSYTMENQFRIEDVTAITGPVKFIEDKLFVVSTKIQSCSVI